MCGVLPEICAPDFDDELATITPMKAGNGPAGGGALLPGSVVQPVPQLGTDGFLAKPLKLAGAAPPLSAFSFDHCEPQNVTLVPFELLPSPITNAPPPGAKAKIRTSQLASAVLPPTSAMCTAIVNIPVDA